MDECQRLHTREELQAEEIIRLTSQVQLCNLRICFAYLTFKSGCVVPSAVQAAGTRHLGTEATGERELMF